MNALLGRVCRTALLLAAGLAVHTAALAQASAASCPPTATAPSAAQVQAGLKSARDHGFLWRIRKDGRESWLYGTIHIARLEWIFPGPLTNDALKASDTLALEIDLLDPEMQRRIANGLAAPTATPLPAALQQRLNRQAEAECVPPQMLATLAPEMQVATLSSLLGRRAGLDPSYGIDIALAGWARSAGKRVVSLETPESQLATLVLPTARETLEFVDSTLAEIEAGRATPALLTIAQVWADGDLATLSRYESWCDCVKTPADRAALARLLDDRNPALADRIAELHASGQRVFAAVGSLHMIGPLGLPSLLARRGFTVEPIALIRR